MNPLLEQFLAEARDFLQGIAEKLMQLENDPNSTVVMNELFRLVHTLKGNSGLFEFPEMTRVLHAGEDLLDAVRDGRVGYSQELTDRLLDAMDFVNLLVDEIESNGGGNGSDHGQNALRLAESLRQLIGVTAIADGGNAKASVAEAFQSSSAPNMPELPRLAELPEQQRMALYRQALAGDTLDTLLFVEYTPEDECFF
ncbi:MAG: Hpt domain-containing protein, partial [Methylobacter sp.]|nr:Hpt domain-containing protein [Methylobacter sp.]